MMNFLASLCILQTIFMNNLSERFILFSADDINRISEDYVVIEDRLWKCRYFYILPKNHPQREYADVIDFMIWHIPDDMKEIH